MRVEISRTCLGWTIQAEVTTPEVDARLVLRTRPQATEREVVAIFARAVDDWISEPARGLLLAALRRELDRTQEIPEDVLARALALD